MPPKPLAAHSVDDLIAPITERLEEHPALVVLIAVAATASATWIDRASGTELSLAALYLGPVALIAWFFGRTPARAWCLLVGAASVVAELSTPGASTAPAILTWNTAAVTMLSLVSAR